MLGLEHPESLASYGGDALIVASRAEIDRVVGELDATDRWLCEQIELQNFLDDPERRLRLSLELPPIIDRLRLVRQACIAAADSYFVGELHISAELREQPALDIQKIATGFAGLGSIVGALTETKVTAQLQAEIIGIAPPNSIHELGLRLAETGQVADGWIRIEKFGSRFVVYIPGTQDWSPFTGKNPFDLTSDFSAISKTGFAGSERGVALAMKQAGISSTSDVLFVGHSQGGIVAANLATGYANSRVLTFGAPLGQVANRLKAETLSLEHEADLVPEIDLRPNPLTTNWVTVTDRLDSANPIAQHEMRGYLQTSAELDRAAETPNNHSMVKFKNEISGFAGDGPGAGQWFKLTRD